MRERFPIISMIVIIIGVVGIVGYFVIYVHNPDSTKVEFPEEVETHSPEHPVLNLPHSLIMEELRLLRADMDALTAKIEYWKEMEKTHGQKKQSQER